MSKIAALGYLVVRGPLDQWRKFGTEVLGAQLADGSNASVAMFRTDDRAFRLVVEEGAPGPDALVALGLEVAKEADLEELMLTWETSHVVRSQAAVAVAAGKASASSYGCAVWRQW
jgi:3,4-dihydroxy-9,10-secoandrosta-1,3,5(10)-triene-9,17-dione 4,5-dioxygenase